jgi:hypothetical protein
MQLPPELLNEPFAYDDNKYRVEIIVSRPRFVFKIEEQKVVVLIGGKYIASCPSAFEIGGCQPSKCSSNVSVLTVCDTYGIRIALEFLKHLLSISSSHPEWVNTYLIGCMATLSLPLYVSGSALSKCSLICYELEKRDERASQELVASSSVSQAFPPELVALITNSLRISKEVSALVIMRRSSTIPTLEEVRDWSMMPGTYLKSDTYLVVRQYERSAMRMYSITKRDDGYYSLDTRIDGRILSMFRYETEVATSLYNYYSYWISRGCNPKKSILLMLERLKKQSLTTEEVCAWIVQLSCDSLSSTKIEYATEDELRAHLLVLIDKCSSIDFCSAIQE